MRSPSNAKGADNLITSVSGSNLPKAVTISAIGTIGFDSVTEVLPICPKLETP